jgi:hypothetical protein
MMPENKTDENAYDPTIVGGRPLSREQLLKGIPRGIEVLIKKASVDPDFRAVLLEKRAEAAAEIELELSTTEVALLTAIPRVQIEKIIENTSVPDGHRRTFLGKVAGAMLMLVGTSLSGGCFVTGIRPRPDKPQPPMTGHAIDLQENQPRTISGAKIPGGNEHLRVKPINKSSHEVSVVVGYECTFDSGSITVSFHNDKGFEERAIECRPTTVLVAKGKREVTIQATATSGDTRWLQVKLANEGDKPKSILNKESSETHEYRAGEYVIKDCSIVRIIDFPKSWKA